LRLALSSRRETKVWMRRKVTRRDDNVLARLAKVFVNGLTIYLNSLENILLLIFLSYMIHVPGVNLDGQPIRPAYYVNAAVYRLCGFLIGFKINLNLDFFLFCFCLFIKLIN